MDKGNESLNISLGHGISITERKNIAISGVSNVDSFDAEEFLLKTSMGYLAVKGENLEIVKLDTYQGTITIKGVFTSLSYIDDIKSKNKDEGIFNKLFKW